MLQCSTSASLSLLFVAFDTSPFVQPHLFILQCLGVKFFGGGGLPVCPFCPASSLLPKKGFCISGGMGFELMLATDAIPSFKQPVRTECHIQSTAFHSGPRSWVGVPSTSDEPGFWPWGRGSYLYGGDERTDGRVGNQPRYRLPHPSACHLQCFQPQTGLLQQDGVV